MKKHYETHVEDTDKLISVAGPVLDYKSWYEQYRKLMEEQAQRKYGLYTPTSEGDDDFPSIPGMIARYSALGLTNEQMAENPVWKDLTGNGHDLQMKNFAWKEGSGISDVYPGFILGDGVDDFSVTEKELNFEDTYTVYTAFIPFQDDPVRGMEMCGKDFKKDLYIYYSGTHLVYYTSGLNGFIPVHINQLHIIVCKRDKTNAVIKNLITGESKTFSVSELIDNPGVYYLWRYRIIGASTSRAAIAGQTICNGHYSTDEEDAKVLAWYKKEYPWLFPDQAWTVTGKTNEDEDRATIANITGNGNNLVLSNFGFAEGSGYNEEGEYAGYLVTDGVDDKIQSKRFLLHRNWTMVGDWRFMPPEKHTNSGIVKSPAIRLYNQLNNITLYINRTTNPKTIPSRSIKAVCSDGRIYLDDWSEFLDTELQTDFESDATITIANYGVGFTKMVFKNLSFYDNQLLDKDDCIKAYNYLQTLKAK